MKKGFIHINRLLTLLILSVVVMSCTASRETVGVIGTGSRKEARETKPQYFVEKTDGSVIVAANDTRLRDPLFKKAFIELDKEVRVPLQEVRAYQTSEAYYKMTPSGFGTRVLKGPIAQYQVIVYSSGYDPTYYAGGYGGTYGRYRTTTSFYYYLQKDNDGPMLDPTESNIRMLVDGYKPSLEYLDDYLASAKKYKKATTINSLVGLGGIGLMLAGAYMGSNGNSGVMYTGAGVAVGSLVYGFINRSRRIKNVRKLGDAVMVYNEHFGRTK